MEWFIGAIVLVLIITLLCRQKRCDVYGLDIKKKFYTWNIDGKKQKLYPKCNNQMERKVSREAFKNKFG
jgi:hypothetical protein